MISEREFGDPRLEVGEDLKVIELLNYFGPVMKIREVHLLIHGVTLVSNARVVVGTPNVILTLLIWISDVSWRLLACASRKLALTIKVQAMNLRVWLVSQVLNGA